MSDTPPPTVRSPSQHLQQSMLAANEVHSAPSEAITSARDALWQVSVALGSGWAYYDMLRGSLAEALGVVDDPTKPWTWLVEEVHALRQRASPLKGRDDE